MHYTLHQLSVFLTVAETSSITKAAELLHLTQPAVSIQLKNLQDQFEVPLTEVIGRKLYITDFGKEIALAAQNILAEVESINHKKLLYQGHLAGTLTITTVSTGKYIMPFFLSDFLQLHPGIELKMDVTNKATVLNSLVNNTVDFALMSIMPESLPLESTTLMANKLFLVGGKKAKKIKRLKITDLENLPLIYREQGSGTRQTMEQFFIANQLQINKKLELTSNEAVKQAVIAGLGFSVMPLIGIKNELQNGDLHIIKVKGLPISTNWHLTWLKSKRLSPVAETFIQYLNEQKNTIIADNFEWYGQYAD